VAFDPQGRVAAGYDHGDGRSGGVVLFDARGERLQPTPLEVKEGAVSSVAFDPQGRIAAGYDRLGHVNFGGGGGVVLFDARGERLWPAPLEVKWGHVRSVAFGPQGRIAGGYNGEGLSNSVDSVVLFDARGERLRPTPLEVKEGRVSSVAFDTQGRIAAGYVGGVVLFDARGERLQPTPLQVQEGAVTSVAVDPQGRIVAGYIAGDSGGVVLFDARGERLWPTPLKVTQGAVTSVAVDPQGHIAAGYRVGVGGGVVLFDADPASWRRKVESVANRNFTWQEWKQYFPERPYHPTIPSRSWPF
jgi:hypothetical protein